MKGAARTGVATTATIIVDVSGNPSGKSCFGFGTLAIVQLFFASKISLQGPTPAE
jgi:hypothetical protein